jgi:hypothetical protein
MGFFVLRKSVAYYETEQKVCFGRLCRFSGRVMLRLLTAVHDPKQSCAQSARSLNMTPLTRINCARSAWAHKRVVRDNCIMNDNQSGHSFPARMTAGLVAANPLSISSNRDGNHHDSP